MSLYEEKYGALLPQTGLKWGQHNGEETLADGLAVCEEWLEEQFDLSLFDPLPPVESEDTTIIKDAAPISQIQDDKFIGIKEEAGFYNLQEINKESGLAKIIDYNSIGLPEPLDTTEIITKDTSFSGLPKIATTEYDDLPDLEPSIDEQLSMISSVPVEDILSLFNGSASPEQASELDKVAQELMDSIEESDFLSDTCSNSGSLDQFPLSPVGSEADDILSSLGPGLPLRSPNPAVVPSMSPRSSVSSDPALSPARSTLSPGPALSPARSTLSPGPVLSSAQSPIYINTNDVNFSFLAGSPYHIPSGSYIVISSPSPNDTSDLPQQGVFSVSPLSPAYSPQPPSGGSGLVLTSKDTLSDDPSSPISNDESDDSNDPDFFPEIEPKSRLSKRISPYSRTTTSEKVKVVMPKIKTQKSKPTITDKKERKRVQNKNAATKYRIKKRNENDEINAEYSALAEKNQRLNTRVDQLTREIDYIKGLLEEVEKAKGIKRIRIIKKS